jgi:hypothetical protein
MAEPHTIPADFQSLLLHHTHIFNYLTEFYKQKNKHTKKTLAILEQAVVTKF